VKVVNLDETNLKQCVRAAERDRVVLTRKGKPVAVVVGVKGADLEQIKLGHSDKLWALLAQRRKQKTISRAELEKRLAMSNKSKQDE
jgi:prevent-host-death family protein